VGGCRFTFAVLACFALHATLPAPAQAEIAAARAAPKKKSKKTPKVPKKTKTKAGKKAAKKKAAKKKAHAKRRSAAKPAPADTAATETPSTETPSTEAPTPTPASAQETSVQSALQPMAEPTAPPVETAATPSPSPSSAETSTEIVAVAPPRSKPIGLTVGFTSAAQLQTNMGMDMRAAWGVPRLEYQRPSGLQFFARLGWIRDLEGNRNAMSNLLLGVSLPLVRGTFGIDVRASGVVPVSTTGGDDADPQATRTALMAADWNGPMFAPNHTTATGALRLSIKKPPLVTFVDGAFSYVRRVHGEMTDPLDDTFMFTSTRAVLGFQLSRIFVYGGAHQVLFIGSPVFRGAGAAARHDHYAFAGLDLTLELGGTRVRPGILYARAVDLPKTDRAFQLGEVSLAFAF
jgi:hypothetical protein